VSDPLTFVDTNVLVYAHDSTERSKHPVAAALIAELWESRGGALSTQVLQEFYVVVTRKLRRPLPRSEARELVAAYGEWNVVQINMPLIIAASDLEERHRMSFWDALIVVAARDAGASRLVSEDLQPGRRLAGVRIEDPFR
jgi:predicted nucleic acid-binding protein